MFVDSLIVFVIVAERILRPISLSESLDAEPPQLEDRGQEPHSLQRGLCIQPGPGEDRVQTLPQGRVGSARKTKWTLGQHFLCPLVALRDDTASSGSQSLGHKSSPGPSVTPPCVVQPWLCTQIPPTHRRSTPDLLHLDHQLESAGPRPSSVSSVWP